MDPTQEAFERDLLSKLLFKAQSNISTETLLLKIFKFFDLNGSGEVRKPDFLKAIAKAGVVLNDQDVQDKLFDIYSQNKQTLNYRDFINQLLAEKQQTQQAPPTNYQGQYQDKVVHLNSAGFQQTQVGLTVDSKGQGYLDSQKQALEILRNRLQIRGSLGLLTFLKALKQSQVTNSLSTQQFSQVVRELRLDVDNNAQQLVFQQADRNQSGFASFQDLVNVIKGQLSTYRLTIIKQVFESFGAFEIPMSFLVGRFHAERHPDTRQFNKRPEELREEFGMALEIYQYLTKKSYFDISSFIDFYHLYAFYLTNDEVFRSIVVSVWDQDSQNSPPRILNKAHTQSQPNNITPTRNDDAKSQVSRAPSQFDQKSQAQQRQGALTPQSQARGSQSQYSVAQGANLVRQVELIIQRIKNRLATRGAKGFISMYRAFKMLDVDKDGQLYINEFRKAIRDHRIDVTDQEIDLVFQYFDRDRVGLIDLWGMIYVLKGDLAPSRQAIVEVAFQKIDKDGRGTITLPDIKNAFQSRFHPEVKSGKKQDDEVAQDFIESFQMLHHINGGFGNEVVSLEEFVEYFGFFSAAIQDDKYFEQIIQLTFKLGTESNLHQNYAGGSKRVFEPDHKKGYLQDHHRYVVSGGSVAANAPYGTFAEPSQSSVKSRPQSQSQVVQQPTQPVPQSTSFNIFKPLEDQGPKRVVEHTTPTLQNGKKVDPILAIKQRVAARGLRGILSIQKKLRQHDRSNLGTVSLHEFSRVFSDLRIQLNEQIVFEAFKLFEVEESGVMNYDSFIKALQGTMSQRRFNVLVTAFESFQQPAVHFEQFIESFNSKGHPDVKSNRKRDDDILTEFLDTFEDNHKLFTSADYIQEPSISFEEFINYYNNLSALIDEDTQFEAVVQGVWPQKTRRF